LAIEAGGGTGLVALVAASCILAVPITFGVIVVNTTFRIIGQVAGACAYYVEAVQDGASIGVLIIGIAAGSATLQPEVIGAAVFGFAMGTFINTMIGRAFDEHIKELALLLLSTATAFAPVAGPSTLSTTQLCWIF
jgi:hypothetical protein